MKVYANSNIGKQRSLNEDSFYLPQREERFCAVADGMGGHNAGEVASALAIETFARAMREAERPNAMAINEAVHRANAAVYASSQSDPARAGMGTTFTALAEDMGQVCIAHVGDSRAYLVRNNAIMRVTMDHTLVEEMVLQGLITVQEARVHPKRNYITRAVGTSPEVEVDLIPLEVRPGDVYLLCSDGLSNLVADREMLEITRGEGTWEEKLDRLVRRALEAGGYDNITAMYISFEESDEC